MRTLSEIKAASPLWLGTINDAKLADKAERAGYITRTGDLIDTDHGLLPEFIRSEFHTR